MTNTTTTIKGQYRDNQIFFALKGESNPSEGIKVHHRLTTFFVSSLKVRIRDGDDFRTFYLDKQSLKAWAESKEIQLEKDLSKKQLLFRVKAYLSQQNGKPPLYLNAERKDNMLTLSPWADSSIKLTNVFQRFFRRGIVLTVVVENRLQKVRVTKNSFKEWIAAENMSFAQEHLTNRELVQKVFEEGRKIAFQKTPPPKHQPPKPKEEKTPKKQPVPSQEGKNSTGGQRPITKPITPLPDPFKGFPSSLLQQILTPEAIKFFTEFAQRDHRRSPPTSPRAKIVPPALTSHDKIKSSPNLTTPVSDAAKLIHKQNTFKPAPVHADTKSTPQHVQAPLAQVGTPPGQVKVNIPPLKIPKTVDDDIPVTISQTDGVAQDKEGVQTEDDRELPMTDHAVIEKKAKDAQKIQNGEQALEKIYQNHYELCKKLAEEISNAMALGPKLTCQYDFKTHSFTDVELTAKDKTQWLKVMRDQLFINFTHFAKELCAADPTACIDEIVCYLFSNIRDSEDQILPEGLQDFINNPPCTQIVLQGFSWFIGLLQRIRRNESLKIEPIPSATLEMGNQNEPIESEISGLSLQLKELGLQSNDTLEKLKGLENQSRQIQENILILVKSIFEALPRHPITPTDIGLKVLEELNRLNKLVDEKAAVIFSPGSILEDAEIVNCIDRELMQFITVLRQNLKFTDTILIEKSFLEAQQKKINADIEKLKKSLLEATAL
ncbi:MAG: hypothetical protein CK425_11625 [Parachlamydia sp.]|nr:MAG: hypothetical protein CK425_11625 [Parachlamydia sp.]